MNDRNALVLAVACSVAAAITVSILLSPPAPGVRPSRPADEEAAALADLETRLRSLEAVAARPEVESRLAEGPQRVLVRDSQLDERIGGIEARLDALERRLAAGALARARPPAPIESEPPAEPAVPSPLSDIEARAWITDPHVGVEQKLKAHEALRNVPDAYTPEMVRELVNIGQFDPDGRVRADVWRFFDGDSDLPVLVDPLLRALTADPDQRAREEAAETLGNQAGDDPMVVRALQHAAKFDEDQRVRDKASRTLGQIGRSR